MGGESLAEVLGALWADAVRDKGRERIAVEMFTAGHADCFGVHCLLSACLSVDLRIIFLLYSLVL